MKFRSERERLIVIWGSVLGIVMLWWSLFFHPALLKIRNYRKEIPQWRADLDRARELVTLLQAPATPHSKQPVVPTIDNALKELHISAEHVKNLKEVGGGAQIQLSEIDGRTLVRLLHLLERRNIRPDSAEFQDFTQKGYLWDVTLTVNQSH